MELKTLLGAIIFVWVCYFLADGYMKTQNGEGNFSPILMLILHFILWPLMFIGVSAPFWTIGLIAFYIFDLIKGNT